MASPTHAVSANSGDRSLMQFVWWSCTFKLWVPDIHLKFGNQDGNFSVHGHKYTQWVLKHIENSPNVMHPQNNVKSLLPFTINCNWMESVYNPTDMMIAMANINTKHTHKIVYVITLHGLNNLTYAHMNILAHIAGKSVYVATLHKFVIISNPLQENLGSIYIYDHKGYFAFRAQNVHRCSESHYLLNYENLMWRTPSTACPPYNWFPMCRLELFSSSFRRFHYCE